MTMRRIVGLHGWVTVFSLFCTLGAVADPPDLVERLPPGANAIAYINVESLLNSKLGRQEDWRSKCSDDAKVQGRFLRRDTGGRNDV